MTNVHTGDLGERGAVSHICATWKSEAPESEAGSLSGTMSQQPDQKSKYHDRSTEADSVDSVDEVDEGDSTSDAPSVEEVFNGETVVDLSTQACTPSPSQPEAEGYVCNSCGSAMRVAAGVSPPSNCQYCGSPKVE